ncbi:MAG: efflux RND transporter periplasmic adaptor subunit [Defluviitaleaceae bacterium]|nr:efflux RND transporter periplasmic adaptor subunit [Defluviitaleaceae bacterium]
MTNSAAAIFIKQFSDVTKNPDALSQFIIYPAMAFIMTHLIEINVPGMPESQFVTMFAKMFGGMAFIGATAGVIAEDIERNSLRFLLMAGVKSHEYLIGIGGVFLTFGIIGSAAFAIMMPNADFTQMIFMWTSLVMGVAASILIGAIIGMSATGQAGAVGLGSMLGLIISFGPFLATMSQNDTMMRIFRIFYTMNFVDIDTDTVTAVENFGIIGANILVFSLLFTIVYGKHNTNKGGAVVSKKAVATIMSVAIIGGAGIAAFFWHNAGFIATDNATVATRTIPVVASNGGVLERFSLREGQSVDANEILGWVEGGEAMRSPVDGLVMQTSAIQGQRVSTAETIAVISDTANVHIQANIEETDILNVHIGQRVYVRIDTFGRRRFEGYVANIGTAALPDMSLTNSRATLLVPVEVNLSDDVDLSRLIGVNADVRIPLR